MVDTDNKDTEIKCIFCEKNLERSEMVRYRGAISCRECAEKQEPSSNPIIRPFVYLAAFGCLIGMLNFIYFTFHVLLFSQIDPATYIQPLVPFFGGMVVILVLIAMGLYAINRVHLYVASIIGMLTALLAAALSAWALYDFATAGPYFILETVTYTKTLNYYPTVLAFYSLFALVAALAILMHMTNIKTEYVSVVAAALFLISATMIMSNWTLIISGFLNVLTYAVAFGFFVTRRRVYEEDAIQHL